MCYKARNRILFLTCSSKFFTQTVKYLNTLKKFNLKSAHYQAYKITIVLGILGLTYNCFGQLSINSIDYSRVPQKKVRSLVKKHQRNGAKYFCDLKSSCYSEQDSGTYSFHRNTQTIKERIQNVWNKLKSIKPRDEYKGKMVSFGFLYSSKLNRILYGDDDYLEIEEGDIIFLNLKLIGGIKNIAVALEVTGVDDKNMTIQLCYINNGMTEGTQQIKLEENIEGNTVICQETRYRNQSKFREKKLYPIFHRRAVNELQTNLKNFIEGMAMVTNQ